MIIKNTGLTRVCIVLPTYNEAGNIDRILGNVFSSGQKKDYAENGILMNVLVVDDNSPDGTARIVKGLQKENNHIYLLSRKAKEGLGAAYIAGIKHALENLQPDIVVEMDADLSHDPSYLVEMINEIIDGADFVVGSRYVKGGSIPKDWGILRKLISRLANSYARAVLGIYEVHDCTGGFRAIRASMLEKIDLDSLNAKGYVFQISLLDIILRNNGIVREVPIAFHDRTNGKSKMQARDIMEVGIVVLKLAITRLFANISLKTDTAFRRKPQF